MENNSYLCADKQQIMALNLKRVMASKGVTQKQLSDLTGVTQANISRMVTGKSQANNATLMRIAEALGVEIYELFEVPSEQFIQCPHCGRKIYISKDNHEIIDDNRK